MSSPQSVGEKSTPSLLVYMFRTHIPLNLTLDMDVRAIFNVCICVCMMTAHGRRCLTCRCCLTYKPQPIPGPVKRYEYKPKLTQGRCSLGGAQGPRGRCGGHDQVLPWLLPSTPFRGGGGPHAAMGKEGCCCGGKAGAPNPTNGMGPLPPAPTTPAAGGGKGWGGPMLLGPGRPAAKGNCAAGRSLGAPAGGGGTCGGEGSMPERDGLR